MAITRHDFMQKPTKDKALFVIKFWNVVRSCLYLITFLANNEFDEIIANEQKFTEAMMMKNM